MRTEPPRILFYSHDGHGLGHLRMTLMLAEELARREPLASILIATGTQAFDATRLPERTELVKLPSVRASGALAGMRPALGSGYTWRGLWAMREAILHETVRIFDPHLIVGDNEPAGMQGELARALRVVRDRVPRARTALGMNDCLGDGDPVRRRWDREGGVAALAGDYDRILVFGQQEVFDPREEYAFPATTAAKTSFTGYLWREQPGVNTAHARDTHGVGPTEPWVVVATGGGEDGFPLLAAACDAVANGEIAARLLLVTGPLLPVGTRRELEERAAALPHVSLVTSVEDLPAHFAAADAVVIMGGYNSVVEAIGAGKRPIIVPRDDGWTEQRQRAERFAELGLAICIRPTALTPERLADAIRAAMASEVSPLPLLALDGIRRAVDELWDLLPAVTDLWPARALPATTLPVHRPLTPPPPADAGDERIVAAWDGTLFHVRQGDLIETEIALLGAFELDVQRALLPWLRPGDVVIDAGANIGCHTCPMAIRVAPHGLVVAIEPVGRLADRLEANCRINGTTNVAVERSAIWSRAERRQLAVPSPDDDNQGEASFHRLPAPAGTLIDVETTTIDTLVARLGLTSVRLVKLDIEGDDFDALLGARETLRQFRPVVAFEYNPELWAKAGHTLADANRLLAGELGYRLSPLASLDEVRMILAVP